MSKILNLRKKQNQGKNIERLIQPESVSKIIKKKDFSSVNPEPSTPPLTHISWEAPSFYYNPQKKYLILIILALSLSGGAMLFFHRDTLMAIFLLLASAVIMLYSTRKPETSTITLNSVGVAVDDNYHSYKDLRSFWIHYNPGQNKELSIASKKWYLPYLKVSIENKNPLHIRSLLINFLPEKEHEDSLVDLIAKKIGFS